MFNTLLKDTKLSMNYVGIYPPTTVRLLTQRQKVYVITKLSFSFRSVSSLGHNIILSHIILLTIQKNYNVIFQKLFSLTNMFIQTIIRKKHVVYASTLIAKTGIITGERPPAFLAATINQAALHVVMAVGL